MTEETLARGRTAGRRVALAPSAGVSEGAWRIVGGMGVAMAMVGWADVVLGLFPLRPGNPDWEIGAVGSTFDSLPLATLGMGFLAASAAAAGSRRLLGALAAVCWVVVPALLAALAVYLLSAPLAWRAVPPPVRGQLAIAFAKTGLLALIYVGLYAWLGATCRRRMRHT